MSVRLEQDAVYILPDALQDQQYAIVQATRTAQGWQLIECHAVDAGSDVFRARASLPPDQMLRFEVDQTGALHAAGSGGTQQQTRFTIANLNWIGYLRNGAFEPAPEGL